MPEGRINEYWTFRCANCGKWGSMIVQKHVSHSAYRCIYCGKTKKLKQKDTWGLTLDSRGPFNHPAQAQSTVSRLNGQKIT